MIKGIFIGVTLTIQLLVAYHYVNFVHQTTVMMVGLAQEIDSLKRSIGETKN